MEFGYHLNFRDPDNIALELSAPNDLLLAAKQALAEGRTSQADITAFVEDNELDLPTPEKG
jgi:glyoxylase I family protein